MRTVSSQIPETVFSALRKNPDEFMQEMRIAAAVKWYELGEISEETAAEIAGLTQVQFTNALSRYKVNTLQDIAQNICDELASESKNSELHKRLSLQEIASLPIKERHKLIANSISLTAEDFLNHPELTEFSVLDGEDWETGNE